MDPIKIFEDIANIVTTDYAGAEELKYPTAHASFLRFCTQMAEQHEFEDEQLYHFVQLYLQTIGDPKLIFNINNYAGFHRYCRGFSARSDGKDLYVTDVCQADQVRLGDKIVQINNYPPASFRSVTSLLKQDDPVSERDSWDVFLNHAQVVYVEHEDGEQEKVILRKYVPLDFVPQFICQKMDKDTVYLKIESFEEEEPVSRLLEKNKKLLTSCKKLILDLRRNPGGYQNALPPLIPYVCDRDMTEADFLQEEEIYTRYSDRNCDLSKAQMARYLKHENPQVREMAQVIISDLEANRGRGFIPDEDDSNNEMIKSCRKAEKIILLTDTFCEDEAEWFVLACRRMMGVTSIGRPTMGNMDYSNLVTVDYGYGITFTYPISKTRGSYEGRGYKDHGVPVDVYVPWTRDEIVEDVILKTALAY